MNTGFLRSVVVIAAIFVVAFTGIASADEKVTDFSKLTVNGVKLGLTSGEVEHVLGVPHKWAPPIIQFKSTPAGRLTVEMANNKSIAVRNGSKLEYGGHPLLKFGDSASMLAQAIDPSIKPQLNPKPNHMTHWVYTQGGTKLTVVVQSNKIVGFSYGVSAGKTP